jgi:CRISPR-associated protein Csb1
VQPSTNAGFVLDAGKETKPMLENAKKKITLTPSSVLNGESPLVLTATLEPVAGLDRFQPAGFPEIGHVIYKAPRKNGVTEHVCIVDSAASMANHLESVCLRGAHDLDLVDDLAGMPYLRCVTGALDSEGKLKERELVVTSLTEGHRIASQFFLQGEHLKSDSPTAIRVKALRAEAKKLKADAKSLDADTKKKQEKDAKEKDAEAEELKTGASFQSALIQNLGIELAGRPNAHPPPGKWWSVFKTIFECDPNSLVHGVLFPQWQIKIPRFLTAHLEAFGASRVDRSGVKFDLRLLDDASSVQPIFAVDDATAQAIRATFVFDISLVRSFGRESGETELGLSVKQKEFLVALALWKVQHLLASPFRFRSGCHLLCTGITSGDADVELSIDIKQAIKDCGFAADPITDVYWPREELYREGKDEETPEVDEADQNEDGPESDD